MIELKVKHESQFEKKKSGSLRMLWWSIFFLFQTYLLLLLINFKYSNKLNTWEFNAINIILRDPQMSIVLIVMSTLLFMMSWYIFMPRDRLKKYKKQRVEGGVLGDAAFQTEEEIRETFTAVELPTMDNVTEKIVEPGWVVHHDAARGQYLIDATPLSVLTFAPSRTGKTTKLLLPDIIFNALARASMLITDPKAEILDLTYPLLKKLGYHITVLNFKETQYGSTFNLIGTVVYYYDQFLEAKRKHIALQSAFEDAVQRQLHSLKISKSRFKLGAKKIDFKGDLKVLKNSSFNNWYFKSYRKINLLKFDAARFEGSAQRNAVDIAAKLIDNARGESKGENPYFQLTSKGGLASAILLTVMFGKPNERHFPSVLSLIEELTIGSSKESQFMLVYQALIENYGRNIVTTVAGGLKAAMGETLSNVLSSLETYLVLFQDESLMQLLNDTSSNNVERFSKERSVIFLVTPENNDAVATTVSVIIQQIYEQLIELADRNSSGDRIGKVQNPVRIMLEELGNIPAITKLESYVSIGMGRDILFDFIVQDRNQVYIKYGKEKAHSIFSNCLLQRYLGLGPSDVESAEQLSKAIGSYTVKTKNVSYNPSELSLTSSRTKSVTESMHERSLLKIEEILKSEQPIIFKATKKPFLAYLVPYYSDEFALKLSKTGFRGHLKSWKDIHYISLEKIKVALGISELNKPEGGTGMISDLKYQYKDQKSLLEERMRELDIFVSLKGLIPTPPFNKAKLNMFNNALIQMNHAAILTVEEVKEVQALVNQLKNIHVILSKARQTTTGQGVKFSV